MTTEAEPRLLPCETCARWVPEEEWCRHVRHHIRNGYAMAWHSYKCGGYKEKKLKEAR